MTDPSSLIRALKISEANEVYNLAAQSFVGTSWDQPILTAEVTGVGVVNLLEAIRLNNPSVKFNQASTSEMFGLIQDEKQSESTLFYPRSPYGVAKLYGYWITIAKVLIYMLYVASYLTMNHL